MADDVVVSDRYLHPHDEGLPNIADGNEDWNSAGLQMLLGQAVQSGSYARSDTELDFAGHDGTNDTVNVQPGVAYLALSGETVSVQNTLGGSSAPTYDVNITAATLPAIMVGLPTAVTVTLQSATLSQVWLAYATDGTVTGVSAGDVYVRGDNDGTTTAPPHPSVELGSANPDDATADTLVNRFGSPEFNSLTTDEASITGETVIDGTRSSATSSTSAGTLVNLVDGESLDNRNEFNSSQQFVPDKSGTYLIIATGDFRGNTAKGDNCQIRVRNTTDSVDSGQLLRRQAAAPIYIDSFTWVISLSAGDVYEIQATNADSSFVIDAAAEVSIRWFPVKA